MPLRSSRDHFAVPTGEIVFDSNRIYAGNRSLSFAELAALSWEKRVSLSRRLLPHARDSLGFRHNTGRPFYYFVYGAAAAEVAIDTLTGESRVLRAELVQDCGRSLNPAIDLARSRGHSCRAWAGSPAKSCVGRRRPPADARPIDLQNSRQPRRAADFHTRLLEMRRNRAATIFRSKAIGEPPLMLAISVWLAMRDAIASLADHRLAPRLDAPATPERVLAAIEICGAHEALAGKNRRVLLLPADSLHPPHSALTRSASVIAVSQRCFLPCSRSFRFRNVSKTYASGLRALERVNLRYSPWRDFCAAGRRRRQDDADSIICES